MAKPDTIQDFIDALVAELEACLPADYIVQAREPEETELKVEEGQERQVFVILEAIEPGSDDVADMATSTNCRFILTVSCVMRRARVLDGEGKTDILASVKATRSVNRRRRSIVQAIQRTRKGFAGSHPYALTGFMDEVSRKVEGFSVSVSGVFVEYDMDSKE